MMNGLLFVGCRTTKERGARGKGIKAFETNTTTPGVLKHLTSGLVNPSWLCLDEKKEFLYTIHGDMSDVSAFSINKINGGLTRINTVSTAGENPVHISIDKTNRWVFVANLQTGTISVIPRNSDGSLGNLHKLYTITGLTDGAISHPHQVFQDISRNYLVVPCQGRKYGFGQIVVFRINSVDGTLEETCTVRSRELAEPRHCVFHASNRYCYCVNEKDFTITAYSFDETQGVLSPFQVIPTLPDTCTDDGWASGIIMDQTSRFVIVSNRKQNSISSLLVDPNTGRLTLIDTMGSFGEQPRFIYLLPNGLLLVANELTDSLEFFNLDDNGKFHHLNMQIKTESPVSAVSWQ